MVVEPVMPSKSFTLVQPTRIRSRSASRSFGSLVTPPFSMTHLVM
jgi:hypothetical protein